MDFGDILKTSAVVIAKRRESYGPPQECFERAATIAGAILDRKVSPYEISIIFHAMKLARITQSPDNPDHYVDGVSYLAFAGEFHGTARERTNPGSSCFSPRPHSPSCHRATRCSRSARPDRGVGPAHRADGGNPPAG